MTDQTPPAGKDSKDLKAEQTAAKMSAGETALTSGGKISDPDQAKEAFDNAPAPKMDTDAGEKASDMRAEPVKGVDQGDVMKRLDRLEAALKLGDAHAMAQAMNG